MIRLSPCRLHGFDLLIVLATAPGLLLAGCGTDPGQAEIEEGPSERPHNVRVLEVQPERLEEYLLITGPLAPTRATDVSTEESGIVQVLTKEKGQLVREGEVIVQLDRRVLEAQMKSAKAVVELREYNDERTKKLLEANSISRQEMLSVETELEQAEEEARIMELRFERAAIKAPFGGILVDRFVELGQLVNPGERNQGDFDIVSYGANGERGGEGEDEDVVN